MLAWKQWCARFIAAFVAASVPLPRPTDIAAQTAQFADFILPTADSAPFGITSGPDGALWFTERDSGKIGRVSVGGQITEFSPPTAQSAPLGITAGPDGNLWFTETVNGSKIGRVSPDGQFAEFTLQGTNVSPFSITPGPDGALWYTKSAGIKIGRITTGGAVTEFDIPNITANPVTIVSGPDGALWFTDSNPNNRIWRMTTSGVFSFFAIPTAQSGPQGLVVGPDGALWFTESSGNKIGRVTTDGQFIEYGIPTSESQPQTITVGPDGALWFTELSGNQIGRITAAGQISEFLVPGGIGLIGTKPTGLVTGPDGAIWFTEQNTNRIGRLVLITSPTPSPTGTARATATATPSPTPTTVAPALGGRNIGLAPRGTAEASHSATTIRWDGGTLQNGYLVARYLPSLVILAPGLLSPSATSLEDGDALSAPAGSLYCYLLGPTTGTPPALAGLSNIVCELTNTRTNTGAPQNLALRVTQTGSAVLAWSDPAAGGQDGFRVVTLSGATIDLDATGRSQTLPLTGFDCFIVFAMSGGSAIGNTDVVCGLPGISSLGA